MTDFEEVTQYEIKKYFSLKPNFHTQDEDEVVEKYNRKKIVNNNVPSQENNEAMFKLDLISPFKINMIFNTFTLLKRVYKNECFILESEQFIPRISLGQNNFHKILQLVEKQQFKQAYLYGSEQRLTSLQQSVALLLDSINFSTDDSFEQKFVHNQIYPVNLCCLPQENQSRFRKTKFDLFNEQLKQARQGLQSFEGYDVIQSNPLKKEPNAKVNSFTQNIDIFERMFLNNFRFFMFAYKKGPQTVQLDNYIYFPKVDFKIQQISQPQKIIANPIARQLLVKFNRTAYDLQMMESHSHNKQYTESSAFNYTSSSGGKGKKSMQSMQSAFSQKNQDNGSPECRFGFMTLDQKTQRICMLKASDYMSKKVPLVGAWIYGYSFTLPSKQQETETENEQQFQQYQNKSKQNQNHLLWSVLTEFVKNTSLFNIASFESTQTFLFFVFNANHSPKFYEVTALQRNQLPQWQMFKNQSCLSEKTYDKDLQFIYSPQLVLKTFADIDMMPFDLLSTQYKQQSAIIEQNENQQNNQSTNKALQSLNNQQQQQQQQQCQQRSQKNTATKTSSKRNSRQRSAIVSPSNGKVCFGTDTELKGATTEEEGVKKMNQHHHQQHLLATPQQQRSRGGMSIQAQAKENKENQNQIYNSNQVQNNKKYNTLPLQQPPPSTTSYPSSNNQIKKACKNPSAMNIFQKCTQPQQEGNKTCSIKDQSSFQVSPRFNSQNSQCLPHNQQSNVQLLQQNKLNTIDMQQVQEDMPESFAIQPQLQESLVASQIQHNFNTNNNSNNANNINPAMMSQSSSRVMNESLFSLSTAAFQGNNVHNLSQNTTLNLNQSNNFLDVSQSLKLNPLAEQIFSQQAEQLKQMQEQINVLRQALTQKESQNQQQAHQISLMNQSVNQSMMQPSFLKQNSQQQNNNDNNNKEDEENPFNFNENSNILGELHNEQTAENQNQTQRNRSNATNGNFLTTQNQQTVFLKKQFDTPIFQFPSTATSNVLQTSLTINNLNQNAKILSVSPEFKQQQQSSSSKQLENKEQNIQEDINMNIETSILGKKEQNMNLSQQNFCGTAKFQFSDILLSKQQSIDETIKKDDSHNNNQSTAQPTSIVISNSNNSIQPTTSMNEQIKQSQKLAQTEPNYKQLQEQIQKQFDLKKGTFSYMDVSESEQTYENLADLKMQTTFDIESLNSSSSKKELNAKKNKVLQSNLLHISSNGNGNAIKAINEDCEGEGRKRTDLQDSMVMIIPKIRFNQSIQENDCDSDEEEVMKITKLYFNKKV